MDVQLPWIYGFSLQYETNGVRSLCEDRVGTRMSNISVNMGMSSSLKVIHSVDGILLSLYNTK